MAPRKKKGNIALFIPHAGCPQTCVFCDQRQISGAQCPPDAREMERAAERAAASPRLLREESELAFFGGSFTALPEEEMLFYLREGARLVRRFGLKGIRLSTRPDALDKEKMELLLAHGVTAVELGAQSFDSRVLRESRRGHTAEDTVRAAELVKRAGCELVLQLMTGLPGDSAAGARASAGYAAELRPDAVRLYPCLVLRGTALARMYAAGEYRPQTLPEAVSLCGELLSLFRGRNIPVIKLGLHASSDFEGDALVAGPYHPAFRELVEGALFLDEVERVVPRGAAVLRLRVEPDFLSTAVGCRRGNVEELRRRLGCRRVEIAADDSLDRGCFKAEIES